MLPGDKQPCVASPQLPGRPGSVTMEYLRYHERHESAHSAFSTFESCNSVNLGATLRYEGSTRLRFPQILNIYLIRMHKTVSG